MLPKIRIAAFLLFSVSPSIWAKNGPQTIESLVNLKFQLDPRIFAVMASIQAAEIDQGASGTAVEDLPAKRLVRERLAKLDPDIRRRLRQFLLARADSGDPAVLYGRLVSLALLLQGPPGFALAAGEQDVPEDARPMMGLESFLQEIWAKGEMAGLWQEVRRQYLDQIETCRPVIRRAILDVLGYLKTGARIALDRVVIFIPDLLSRAGIVNARNVGDNYYLIVGPSPEEGVSARAIRHEYLHFLLDPLIRKHHALLPDPKPFLKAAVESGYALPRYSGSFDLLVTESLIQTLEIRMDKEDRWEESGRMIRIYDSGLLLGPYFSETFEKFERGEESIQEFFPKLFQGIQWDKEKTRSSVIREMREELERYRTGERAKAQAIAIATESVRSLLRQANDHLLAGEFEQAESALGKVLELSPDNPNALYGMAQVAGRAANLEQALEYYQQAAVHAGVETWIAAWSHVRRGTIYRFMGMEEAARSEWSKVEVLSGNLRGADQAAAKLLREKVP